MLGTIARTLGFAPLRVHPASLDYSLWACAFIAYGTAHVQSGVAHGAASNVTMLCSEATLALLLAYVAYIRHDAMVAVLAAIPAVFAFYCAVAHFTAAKPKARKE